MTADRFTIAIPTYRREGILAETIEHLFRLDPPPAAIIIADQTPRHQPEIEAFLRRANDSGRIRWLRLDPPSIPRSMNVALREAATEFVLFLDDDVVPPPGLVARHAIPFTDPTVWAVVGQVLTPGQRPTETTPAAVDGGPLSRDLDFPFNSTRAGWVENVMAGNLSVRRDRALAIGGFDENFVGAAYRFETDFAKRVIAAGGRIRFEPPATLLHLQHREGGVRSFGHHLRTMSPMQSVGDYYFAMVNGGAEAWAYVRRRLFRSFLTRYHVSHPWWILPKIVGELRGLLLARRLVRGGRRLL